MEDDEPNSSQFIKYIYDFLRTLLLFFFSLIKF